MSRNVNDCYLLLVEDGLWVLILPRIAQMSRQFATGHFGKRTGYVAQASRCMGRLSGSNFRAQPGLLSRTGQHDRGPGHNEA